MMINQTISDQIEVDVGIPQRSILGPMLFYFYIPPLFDIIDKMDKTYHFYSDDSQLSFDFNVYRLQKVNRVMDVVESTFIQSHQIKVESKEDRGYTFYLQHFFLVVTVFNQNTAVSESVKLLGLELDL